MRTPRLICSNMFKKWNTFKTCKILKKLTNFTKKTSIWQKNLLWPFKVSHKSENEVKWFGFCTWMYYLYSSKNSIAFARFNDDWTTVGPILFNNIVDTYYPYLQCLNQYWYNIVRILVGQLQNNRFSTNLFITVCLLYDQTL